MANNHAVAAARDLIGPKFAAAIDGAHVMGVAIAAGSDLLRELMQKHPYVLLAGSLALGAVVGLLPVKANARER
jgi:hypothetical protein